MFETMQGFLFFFIPTCAAIILGILFEERLIAFEQRLKARLFRRRSRRNPAVRKVPCAAKRPLPTAQRGKTETPRRPAA